MAAKAKKQRDSKAELEDMERHPRGLLVRDLWPEALAYAEEMDRNSKETEKLTERFGQCEPLY